MAGAADLVTVIVPINPIQEKVPELSLRWQNETGLVAIPTSDNRNNQAVWTKMQAAKKAESLLENPDVIPQSRRLATSSKQSPVWLSALPVATLGNLLDDSSLRVAVGL